MRLQVFTHNVGGLYTEELLDAACYAGPSPAGKAPFPRGASGPRRPYAASCSGGGPAGSSSGARR
jgi:hypothetical protein